MSVLVTALTLVVGFPVAYYIAKIAPPGTKGGLLLLCLIPLWVSDLVRAFGWIVLLRETGLVSGFLQWAGLVSGPVELLYNDVTVVIGLVYTVVLFMIVPLVSTLDGMDNSLLEAGYNLGGSRLHGAAADRHPLRDAGDRRRLHHRLHADGRQLPDAGAARRQELELVHPADLQPVHHPLQLGGRRDLRGAAARSSPRSWSGSGCG